MCKTKIIQNLFNKIVWSTVSKALEKSNINKSVTKPFIVFNDIVIEEFFSKNIINLHRINKIKNQSWIYNLKVVISILNQTKKGKKNKSLIKQIIGIYKTKILN